MPAPALDLWWWGEDEAPGLARWLEAERLRFAEETGAALRTRLLRHDEAIFGRTKTAEGRLR